MVGPCYRRMQRKLTRKGRSMSSRQTLRGDRDSWLARGVPPKFVPDHGGAIADQNTKIKNDEANPAEQKEKFHPLAARARYSSGLYGAGSEDEIAMLIASEEASHKDCSISEMYEIMSAHYPETRLRKGEKPQEGSQSAKVRAHFIKNILSKFLKHSAFPPNFIADVDVLLSGYTLATCKKSQLSKRLS